MAYSTPNRRRQGYAYEALAAEYLEQLGHRILERNYSCRMGEIDLISRVMQRDSLGCEEPYLVFTEVKYRSSSIRGDAVSAVHAAKQRTIMKVARFYMLTHGIPDTVNCRFDVAAIQNDEIFYYPNAFGGM